MTDYEYLNNTRADIRLLGIPNIMSPMAQFTSAPRMAMLNHHLPQTMIIDKPEFNKLFTGVEHNLIDYTFNSSRREQDCEIVAIIPKYLATFLKGGHDDYPQTYVIVLTWEPDGSRKLDYFTVDKYFMGVNGFGFMPVLKNPGYLRVGAILTKDQIITHSPAVKGNQYCMGTNLNVVYGSFPETVEDAFIISRSAADRLQTVQIKEVLLNFRQDRRPLNLYGDENTDLFLPDIGSYVREDGALCASRPIHWTTCIADTDPRALRHPLPLQDDISYVEAGAKIVDITFNRNRSKRNDCYPQAEQYILNNNKCWEAIYNAYRQHKTNGVHLTPKMSTLVTTAIYRMIAEGVKVPALDAEMKTLKIAKSFELEGANGQMVDFLQAIVTYACPRLVNNGDKLTDLQGSK